MRAWRAWLDYIDDRHAAKTKTHSAAAFWRIHQAAVAFQQWQQQVALAHEMKGKAAIIVGKLRNSTQVSPRASSLQVLAGFSKYFWAMLGKQLNPFNETAKHHSVLLTN